MEIGILYLLDIVRYYLGVEIFIKKKVSEIMDSGNRRDDLSYYCSTLW